MCHSGVRDLLSLSTTYTTGIKKSSVSWSRGCKLNITVVRQTLHSGFLLYRIWIFLPKLQVINAEGLTSCTVLVVWQLLSLGSIKQFKLEAITDRSVQNDCSKKQTYKQIRVWLTGFISSSGSAQNQVPHLSWSLGFPPWVSKHLSHTYLQAWGAAFRGCLSLSTDGWRSL